mmetsp:Transcript_1726/g.3720  ORF Transcript_1726/g.3720 Transcript_1726/m.3720 type:complete len:133 (-) Transcript_1726:1346-1744(-)
MSLCFLCLCCHRAVFAFLLASLVLPCDGRTPLLLTYVSEDEDDFKLKSSLLDRKTEKYVRSPVTDFIEVRQDDIAVDIGLLNEACEALDEVEALSRRTSVDSSTTTSSVLSASSLLTRPATAISFMTAPQQV